jgi:hypothetical protein
LSDGYITEQGYKEGNSQTTLVCFHDLLGFGEMVSLSGGSLDSAVGDLCKRRIHELRKNIGLSQNEFPSGTKFFQMNDSAVAVFDIDHFIARMHLQKSGIKSNRPNKDIFLKVIQFLIASAELHMRTEFGEEQTRIGPAGRTIVVAGHRWPIENNDSDLVTDVPELQANLAFSEAYILDSLGSSIGLQGLSMYMNDLFFWLLKLGAEENTLIAKAFSDSADVNGMGFPELVQFGQGTNVSANIFHRSVEYRQVHSHVVSRLRRVISEYI